MRIVKMVLLGILAVMCVPRVATAGVGDVTLTLAPASNPVVLGEAFDVRVTVTNTGSDPTPSLVIHVDVTDPTSAKSVDPEDWTSTLSKTIGVVGPGESTTLEWHLQPISPGDFSLYAVALSADAHDAVTSNVATVGVIDHRSLNPGGILPVAIGVPALLGFLLLIRIRPRREGRRTEAGA